ncbi:LuxR C-terminal-related transcriptional regulator [Shinella daejeonensis]|uniref:helix-turn-helix transcriptional regulator n=1 Tax=Shinella daejeonensis TaxID=659017 RepID=UPI0020C77590|nr:LuxR C-terminal-related transcriptional regulator [Shinella daejeonensis]MCP8896360.1 LuxR C-terminal-related transcriptional regulator [Shinella daejeonensis]
MTAKSKSLRFSTDEAILPDPDNSIKLTERERQVMSLSYNGLIPEMVAESMGLSTHTIQNLLKSSIKKLTKKKNIPNNVNLNYYKLEAFKLFSENYLSDIGKKRKEYRKLGDMPHPELPAFSEKNRTKKKITLRFEEAVIEKIDFDVEKLKSDGVDIDRNKWIEQAILLKLDLI